MYHLFKTWRNLEIMSHKHPLEIFLSPPAPAAQRPQRRLSRFSASFVFAAKRGDAGSKNVQRAQGALISKALFLDHR
jgi:hypothetical protein